MTKDKKKEYVKNITSLAEAMEFADTFFKFDPLTGVLFEYLFKPNEVHCIVVEQEKKLVGKEAVYSKKQLFRETGSTAVEAFQKAVTRHLG